jgi:hypothetical protein
MDDAELAVAEDDQRPKVAAMPAPAKVATRPACIDLALGLVERDMGHDIAPSQKPTGSFLIAATVERDVPVERPTPG